jgi:PAS domain S-box-containing protein
MHHRTILIVDNDPVAARALHGRLERLGFPVEAIASSDDAALPLLPRAALAIVDVPPDWDSARVHASTLLHQHAPAILFMIPESLEAELRLAPSEKSIAFIAKPFSDRELRTHIDLALCKLDLARALHGIEDRFFSTSIDMLCFLGFDGHFKRLNPAWERTLGFTRQELMSRPFIEFVHPDDRERTLEQNGKVRSGGQALGFENRYLCKDGSFRWFLWNAAPDSPEQMIYSVARDVTVSKTAANEREQLVRELQSALDEVKALRGILPICSYCRRIRDGNDYWHTVENYISTQSTTLFTHGICPSCEATELEPQFAS